MRRAAGALAAALLCLSLACCAPAGSGSDVPQASSGTAEPQPQGELTVSCPEEFLSVLRRASAPFEEKYPDVTLRFTVSAQNADVFLTGGFSPADLTAFLDVTDWYTRHSSLFTDGAQRGEDGRVYGIPFALNGALFWTYLEPQAPLSLEAALTQASPDAPLASCGSAESLLWGAVLPLYVRECESAGREPTFGPEAPDSAEFAAALARTEELFDAGVLARDSDARRTWTGSTPLLDDLYTPSRMKSRVNGLGDWSPSCALLFRGAEKPAVCLASECFFLSADSPNAQTALLWLEELYANINRYYKKADLFLPAAYPLPVQSGTMSAALEGEYTLFADPDLSLYFADLTWTEDQHAQLLARLDAMLSGE